MLTLPVLCVVCGCKITALGTMLQRFLSVGNLRRATGLRSVLVGVSIREPPAFCCCAPLLSRHTTNHRWLLTSASSRAALPSKPPDDKSDTASPDFEQAVELDPLQDKSMGLFQRFKKTFKQYGKVMIPVHLLTSSVWFGTFYYAAMK